MADADALKAKAGKPVVVGKPAAGKPDLVGKPAAGKPDLVGKPAAGKPDLAGKPAPMSKNRRHALIEEILSTEIIASQPELQEALEARGVSVAQATLSRDLIEVRATKVRDTSGRQIYVLAAHAGHTSLSEEAGEQKLRRWAEELLVGVAQAQNLLVLRTPAGAANLLAAALDAARFEAVVGSVAGDDTILVVCVSDQAAAQMAEQLLSFGK